MKKERIIAQSKSLANRMCNTHILRMLMEKEGFDEAWEKMVEHYKEEIKSMQTKINTNFTKEERERFLCEEEMLH